MVKYLSDNKSDQRFQTILSKPAPFQATVAEEKYPVDEIDLSKSLGVIQNVGNAYFRQQGEEQQRESMGLSFELYQANRAEQQAREAQARSKEKETGLKNTMLNDFAAYVDQGIEAFNQNPQKFSREQLERYIREGEQMYLRNGGAVININDLTGVEKNKGLTLTKDLMKEASDRAVEEAKAYDKSVRDSDRALMNAKMGVDKVTQKPNADKYDNVQIAAMASNFKRQFYGLNINAQADKSIGLSSPSEATKVSIHDLAYGDLVVKKNNYEDRMSWAEAEADIAEEADSILQWAAENDMQISDNDALFMARQAAEEAGYFGDMNYADSMLSSALTVKKNLSDYAKLDSATELEISENERKIKNLNTLKALESGRPVEASDLFGLINDENSGFYQMVKNNPALRQKIHDVVMNIKTTDGVNGTSAGTVHRTVVTQLPDGQKQEYARGVYEQADNIYRGRSRIFGKYAGPYGAGLALGSIHNEVTTVQPRDAGSNNVTNPETKQRLENTERLAIPAFEKWQGDGTLDMMSEEEQAMHYSNYFDDITLSATSRLETMRQGGWLNNIRYDDKTGEFVVVNVTDEQAKKWGNITGAETLWPQVDALNRYFKQVVDYKGLFGNKNIKDSILQSYKIKPLENTDKIWNRNNTIKFMQGNWIPSKTGAIVGAIIGGSSSGIPGVLLGGALGATGGTGYGTLKETLDTFTSVPTALREAFKGNFQEAGAAVANSMSTKAATWIGETAAKGLNIGGEMVAETQNFLTDTVYKTGEELGSRFVNGVQVEKIPQEQTEGQPEMLVNAYEKLDYKGNINLFDLPFTENEDGSVSTVKSITVEHDGDYYIIPTLVNGVEMNSDMADKRFLTTGQHLGKYRSKKEAKKAAKDISGFEDLRYRWEQNRAKIPTVDSRQAIMNNILEGNIEGLTVNDAERALDYYNSLGPVEKFRLSSLGFFNRNAEQILKDTLRDLKSTSKKGNSKQARSLKEEYIPGIL